jgi:hypothetical protein
LNASFPVTSIFFHDDSGRSIVIFFSFACQLRPAKQSGHPETSRTFFTARSPGYFVSGPDPDGFLQQFVHIPDRRPFSISNRVSDNLNFLFIAKETYSLFSCARLWHNHPDCVGNMHGKSVS